MRFRLVEALAYLDKDRDIVDWGTGKASGTDIFADTTGTSFYDQLFTNKDYMLEKENMVGTVEYMTPRQYFEECAKVFTEHSDHAVTMDDLTQQRGRDKRIIDELSDIVTKYHTKLFMPYINYAEGQQEGLHRMLMAANMFGWDDEKFPVLVIRWADEDLHKRQVDEKYRNRMMHEIDTAITNALSYRYPTDERKCREYLIDQIQFDLDRAQRYMSDEDLEKAKSSIDFTLDNDNIIFNVNGMQFPHERIELVQEDDEDDADMDAIDLDDIDLSDLGDISDFFVK